MTGPLSGVIAAVLTPVDATLEPNVAKASAYYARLLANGCDGLNVLGTTGEAMSLSLEQRLRFMRGLAKSGLPLARMMVGTGSASLADTTVLTSEAHELGFGGALILPPFFYRDASNDGILTFFQHVAKRTKAKAGFVYLYNFPAMSGTKFAPDLVGRIDGIMPLGGLKDSSNDLAYCTDLHERFPALRIFPSSETHLRFAKNTGLAGCVSGTVALWANAAQRVWIATQVAESERLQRELAALREALIAHPLIPAVRFLTSVGQGDASWEAPLPPLEPLAQKDRDALLLFADTLS